MFISTVEIERPHPPDYINTTYQTHSPKYSLEDEVNLYELLPALSFSVPESTAIINGLNSSKVLMKELVNYFGYQIKQQAYKDYQGVAITAERISLIKTCVVS